MAMWGEFQALTDFGSLLSRCDAVGVKVAAGPSRKLPRRTFVVLFKVFSREPRLCFLLLAVATHDDAYELRFVWAHDEPI